MDNKEYADKWQEIVEKEKNCEIAKELIDEVYSETLRRLGAGEGRNAFPDNVIKAAGNNVSQFTRDIKSIVYRLKNGEIYKGEAVESIDNLVADEVVKRTDLLRGELIAMYNAKEHLDTYEYICGECGTKFISSVKNRKYCGTKCSSLVGRRAYNDSKGG